MSPSATPATQKTAASRRTSRDQAHHQSQPNAKSATPATPSGGRCHQVPRPPNKVTVDVPSAPATGKGRGVTDHGIPYGMVIGFQ